MPSLYDIQRFLPILAQYQARPVGPAPAPPGAQLYPIGQPPMREPLVSSETSRPFRFSPAMMRLPLGVRTLITCVWNDKTALLDLASLLLKWAQCFELEVRYYESTRGADPATARNYVTVYSELVRRTREL